MNRANFQVFMVIIFIVFCSIFGEGLVYRVTLNSTKKFPYHLAQTCINGDDVIETLLMKNLRNFEIINFHNEAARFWLENFRTLKENGPYTLVHVDSHSDLSFPRGPIVSSRSYEKLMKVSKMDIGSFIYPMVYTGLIDRIIFIHPFWDYRIADVIETFEVGTNKQGYLSSTSRNFIFFSEHQWDELYWRKPVELIIETPGKFNFSSLKINPDKTFLDIDIDYFSTINPTINWYHEKLGFSYSEIKNGTDLMDYGNYCVQLSEIPKRLYMKVIKEFGIHVDKSLLWME